jgi:hypothetical protein
MSLVPVEQDRDLTKATLDAGDLMLGYFGLNPGC